MTALAAGLALLLHAALLLGLAPLLAGATGSVQARLLGRAGRGILAPYHDLRHALRKQPVAAEGATFWSRTAPPIVLSAVICAALLVPSFALGMATAPLADLLTILGLLAVARIALVLGALDLGTTAGGLAAARATTQAALAAPAIVALAFALALLTGSTNLDFGLGVLRDGPIGSRWPAAIALGGIIAALALIAMAAIGRPLAAPADDGSTLGLGHAGLLLEYSGIDLALLEYAESLQVLVWLSLIGAVAWPTSLAGAGALPGSAGTPGDGLLAAWAIGLLGWAVKIAMLGAGLAAYEVAAARMSARRVTGMLGTALVLASLGVLLLFAAQAAT